MNKHTQHKTTKQSLIPVVCVLLTTMCHGGDEIDKLVEHDSSVRRWGAVVKMIEEYDGSELVQQLNRLTKDPSIKVRTRAIEEMGDSHCYDAVPILKELQSTETNKQVRAAIHSALKELGPTPDYIKEKQKADARTKAKLKAKLKQFEKHNKEIKTEVVKYILSQSQYYDGAEQHMFEQACMHVMQMDDMYRISLDPTHKDHDKILNMYREVVPVLAGRISTILRVTNAGDIVCYIPERKNIMTIDQVWAEVLKKSGKE